MANTLTSDQVSANIIADLKALRSDIDSSSGTLVKDVCADSPATEIGLTWQAIGNMSNQNSISYISSLSDAQVLNLASDFNLTRKGATQSQGFLVLFRRTSPPSTITINTGSTVSTQKSSSGITYSFVTLNDAVISSNSFNVATGLWETTVAIQSVLSGSDQNVAANTITVSNGIAGIDGVVNRLAITSGTDAETNAQLAVRITLAAQARLIGTVPGYQSLVNAISGVTASAVVPPGECVRAENGNEADIIILGESVSSKTQTEAFNSVIGLCIYLESTPVISIATIEGASGNYIEGNDFAFVRDTSSEYYGSTQAKDQIIWLNGGNWPPNNPSLPGNSYTITYNFNELIETVQNTLELPQNLLIASDTLARQATEVLVDMTISVGINSAVSSSNAISQIESAIADYISSLGMGSSLFQSEIIAYLINNLSFITGIKVPFTNIAVRGTTGTSDLTLSQYSYWGIDENSLTINVI